MQAAPTAGNALVSVLIVTWNRRADVLETLASVYTQPYRPIEVVLVDNASNDSTVAAVREHYPDVVIVALPENLGPAGGRNHGLPHASGEIIFFLDSDASLTPKTLPAAVNHLHHHPEISAITCKVLNATTREIDRAAWLFSEVDMADADEEFISYAFSEGASAIRREVFDDTGEFWDFLFYGREGEEFAVRAFGAGHEIRYLPSSVVLHRVSPTRRVNKARQLYYDLRNALAIYLRNYPLWFLALVAPQKALSSVVKGLRHRRLGAIFRALGNVTTSLPIILRERDPIPSHRAWAYFGHQRAHGPFRRNLISWLRYNKYEAPGSEAS